MSLPTTMSEVNAHNARVEAGRRNAVSRAGNAPPGDFEAKTGSRLTLTLSGQIRGGKNNLIVTRSGHRFPRPEWAKWRDSMVSSIKSQLPQNFKTIESDCPIVVEYWAGDKRRRDMPAIIDSIFHVLERAGVVGDDTLLWVVRSSRGYDKENPRATITFEEAIL